MSATRNLNTAPSERLLQIDWQGDTAAESAPLPAVTQAASPDGRVLSIAASLPRVLRTQQVTVRLDEVFAEIRPYAAAIATGKPSSSILGRSLIAQANAIFSLAFANLRARFGEFEVYAQVAGDAGSRRLDDLTAEAVEEVRRLQGLARAA